MFRKTHEEHLAVQQAESDKPMASSATSTTNPPLTLEPLNLRTMGVLADVVPIPEAARHSLSNSSSLPIDGTDQHSRSLSHAITFEHGYDEEQQHYEDSEEDSDLDFSTPVQWHDTNPLIPGLPAVCEDKTSLLYTDDSPIPDLLADYEDKTSMYINHPVNPELLSVCKDKTSSVYADDSPYPDYLAFCEDKTSSLYADDSPYPDYLAFCEDKTSSVCEEKTSSVCEEKTSSLHGDSSLILEYSAVCKEKTSSIHADGQPILSFPAVYKEKTFSVHEKKTSSVYSDSPLIPEHSAVCKEKTSLVCVEKTSSVHGDSPLIPEHSAVCENKTSSVHGDDQPISSFPTVWEDKTSSVHAYDPPTPVESVEQVKDWLDSVKSPDHSAVCEDETSSHAPVPVRMTFKERLLQEAVQQWESSENIDHLRWLMHYDDDNDYSYLPEPEDLMNERRRYESYVHNGSLRYRRPFHVYGTDSLYGHDRLRLWVRLRLHLNPETPFPPDYEAIGDTSDGISVGGTLYSQETSTAESSDSDAA